MPAMPPSPPSHTVARSALESFDTGAPAFANDPVALMNALAAFCDAPFPSEQEIVIAALALVRSIVGLPTAYVTRIHQQQITVRDIQDGYECGIAIGATVPLESTFCQYVRATDAPVVISDAAVDSRVRQLASRETFAMGAYIGIPLHLHNGALYGTLCAVGPNPRDFEPIHTAALRIIAQRIVSFIEHDQHSMALLRAEHEAKHNATTALQAIDNQTTVLHTVAHDLRTPLTSMRGYVDMICADVFGPVWPRQREALDNVRGTMQWMQRLVNDIVDVAALDGQTFTLQTGRYQPAALVEQVVALCQPLAKHSGVALATTTAPAMFEAIGDADRVQQVLLNLISNGLRYTKQGHVEVQVKWHESEVEFRVCDTGPGIPAAAQAQIWNRYVRGNGQEKGLGLGLYAVQRIVQAMGGQVGLESQPGVGSQFYVRLPQHGPAPQRVLWTNTEHNE